MQKTRLLFNNPIHKFHFHLQSWKILVLAAGLVLTCLILFTYSIGSTTAGYGRAPSQPSSGVSPIDSSDPGDKNGNGNSNAGSDSKAKESSTNACSIDLNTLRLHAENSSTIDYARITIGLNRTEHFTAFPESIDVSIPSYRTIKLDTEAGREYRPEDDCTTSVTIEAPMPIPKPDASHMVFGVATTLDTLEGSLEGFAHWAGSTGATVIAVVEQGGSAIRSRIKQQASDLGLKLTIAQTEDDRFDRYFSLIRVLYQHVEEATMEWAVLIDDDTFFPSMRNLITQLAAYDAKVPQYIGGVTEDMARLSNSGYMAYGGAGIFLSIPLLSDLQYVFETCHSFKDKGDRMLASCIYAHTDAKFTWERGLHQLDLHGDVSGFFESGRPLPLSVHHWNSWFQADMVALGKVADICGDECLLHRFHLSKSKDWFLVNGYSVIQDATLWNDPRPMEQTWETSKYEGSDPFAYSLGPLRRVDRDKVSLRLMGVVQDPDKGRVRQVYVLKGTDEKPSRVLEVVWTVVQDEVD
ncbi:hypothetical protein BJX70DRAFT_361220 [Aspergillus crustosus]